MEWNKFKNEYEEMLVDDRIKKVPIIPAGNWPYCGNCNQAMKVLKNGVILIATEHHNATSCDSYICRNCQHIIYLGGDRWVR